MAVQRDNESGQFHPGERPPHNDTEYLIFQVVPHP